MSIKSYLKEWDILAENKQENKQYFEERKPIEGFKIGDFVKIIGLSKNAMAGGSKDDFTGRFGVISSMKNNGKPDYIIFLKKNGKESDEADFANKFIFEPAKKCKICAHLFTDKELDKKGNCKVCAKAII